MSQLAESRVTLVLWTEVFVMCCVQAERVFPASDSEESEEAPPRGPLTRTCPPPRDLPLWGDFLQDPPPCRHHLLPARRSFSSSLVAELSAVGPGPTFDTCEFLVSVNHSYIFFFFILLHCKIQKKDICTLLYIIIVHKTE